MAKDILGVKLYSIDEAAEIMGVTKRTASKYIRERDIPITTISGRRYVSEEGLKAYLNGKPETIKGRIIVKSVKPILP